MQFLTISERAKGFTDADFAARIEAEAQQARTLYSEGFLRQIWHRSDRPGACLLFEAASEEEVRERLNTLPFVRAGMLDVTIIPLKPYGGFGPRKD
jgi:muconolactone delta-isomerase